MLCVFDFDGTIVESKPAYYKAVGFYSKNHNLIQPSIAEMDGIFGNIELTNFKNWNSNSEQFRQQMDEIFTLVDEFACQDLTLTQPFPNMVSLLQKLTKQNVKLAIVTSRALQPMIDILKHHNLYHYFESFRTRDDVLNNKHRPKPFPDKLNCVVNEFNYSCEKVIMIGDTIMDIEMAKALSIYSIGVSWGFSSAEKLTKCGADVIAHNVDELENIISNFFIKEF